MWQACLAPFWMIWVWKYVAHFELVIHPQYKVAIISDSGISTNATEALLPALIVLDLQTGKSKRMLSSYASVQADSNVWVEVNGKKCFTDKPMMTGADGIALSCDFSTLYWTPLTSRTLYTVDADMMLMYDADEQNFVNESIALQDKTTASDGMLCSNKKELYFTSIEQSAIFKLGNSGNISLVFQSKEQLIWPDTLSLSSDGYLYVVSNNLCDWLQGLVTDYTKPNYFIWKIKVDAQSYLAGCNEDDRKFGIVETILAVFSLASWVVGVVVVIIGHWVWTRFVQRNAE